MLFPHDHRVNKTGKALVALPVEVRRGGSRSLFAYNYDPATLRTWIDLGGQIALDTIVHSDYLCLASEASPVFATRYSACNVLALFAPVTSFS